MTNLPPEANNPQNGAAGQVPPQQPQVPQQPPAQQPQVPQQQPPVQPPQAPQQPPAQPQYQAPPAGAYQQQPPQGYPGYPPQGQPGYAQPGQPGQPGYPPPGQPGYGQPQPGYAQPAPSNPADSITLNYWLSVFFSWIPALIFYMIEKDKGDPRARYFHAANLNFSLIRVAAAIVLVILYIILAVALPWYMWWIPNLIMWLGNLAMLVLHAIAAFSASDNYRDGKKPNFIFNFDLVK